MEAVNESFEPGEREKILESAAGEGRAFGATAKQAGCTDEAFRRRLACGGLICSVQANFFLEACLATSQKEALLCRGAPSKEDLMATIYWRLARCEERGAPTQVCNRLMGTVQEYCASPKTSL
jgi:hypothetical protein